MAYDAVTVANTATLIAAGNTKRRNLVIVNNSDSTTIFYGPDASVTAANGVPLYANQTLNSDKIPEGWVGPVYGITASGTANVRYWESER